MRPPKRTMDSLLVFTSEDPVRLPMGVIPISTPKRKSERPMIIRTEPTRNLAISAVPSGTRVKFRTKTTATMGTTVLMLSLKRLTRTFKRPPCLL